MVDTELVLWLIPPVLVGIALLAKLYTHLTKRSRQHPKAEPDQV